MNDITPAPLDDKESVDYYLRRKLPEWHSRLRSIESEFALLKVNVQERNKKIDEMHIALIGTPDGRIRGFNLRVSIIEGWRSVVNWSLWGLYLGGIAGLFTWLFTSTKGK